MSLFFQRLTRRRFLAAAAAASSFIGVAVDAVAVEPHWIRVRKIRLSDKPTTKIVHFTDLHHKGNRGYLSRIVAAINDLEPNFVCFTGDLIEEREHVRESLEMLENVNAPIYGVPGNHDYWCDADFGEIGKSFAKRGGAWLLDQTTVTHDRSFSISGAANLKFKREPFEAVPGTRHILLMHYPAWVKKLSGRKFDLVLAGHSHGGQVRIPFIGAPIVPFGVDEYEVGLFQTAAGPLYVNPGLGWFPVPIRFRCRPELTVFEL